MNLARLYERNESLDTITWCAEFQRDPSEIERVCGLNRAASSAERDDYVAAGASHVIVGMSEPWDYDAIEELVHWRDSRNRT